MSKRKNNDPGRVRQLHPTRSFEQLVADATLGKFSGYIDGQVQGAAEAMSIRLAQNFRGVVERLIAVEEILCETVSGLTKEVLANRIADIQDRGDGLVAVEGPIVEGDRVRLQIQTRTADQTEYQGKSRFQLENAGSGNTLGKELETALIGMKAGETKEITFGKDDSMKACITVDKVSREPAPEVDATAVDEGTLETSPEVAGSAEGEVNASADAG